MREMGSVPRLLPQGIVGASDELHEVPVGLA